MVLVVPHTATRCLSPNRYVTYFHFHGSADTHSYSRGSFLPLALEQDNINSVRLHRSYCPKIPKTCSQMLRLYFRFPPSDVLCKISPTTTTNSSSVLMYKNPRSLQIVHSPFPVTNNVSSV